MKLPISAALQNFREYVGIKFQLYNSLFTSLPFHKIEKTGIYLALLLENCSDGYRRNQSPEQIITSFFAKHTNYQTEEEQAGLLFRFIQYVERQVVLFDALEDAAFNKVTDTKGAGTLQHLISEVLQNSTAEKLAESLKDFSVKLVLTAHPTQFYPGSVLGIINDLSMALRHNETSRVNMYLQQLGKTPFLNKQRPTPYDEAMCLLWFLENVFYEAAGNLIDNLELAFPGAVQANHPVIKMGFWPGGDRDGNPNVNTETTLRVASALRHAIINCYYRDVRQLRHRLTFKGVDTIVAAFEKQLYDNIFSPDEDSHLTKQSILDTLQQIKKKTLDEHDGLFVSLIDNLLNKVHVFGLHFASLDIRQESSVHNSVLEMIAEKEEILPGGYALFSEENKIKALISVHATAQIERYEPGLIRDTLESMAAIKKIQQQNGEEGCHRYIISQCRSAVNVLEVYGLLLLSGWQSDSLKVDIVPLFETISDLQNASGIMTELYSNKIYKEHLARRGKRQTIMLGFSDGTKDGGYLAANWGIYKAKKELTAVSVKSGIKVIFFDGRGGPPARGGGKSHKFYASMGKEIANNEIQLTIQGQTISSSYGSISAAQYNIEQLLHAGVSNTLFSTGQMTLTTDQQKLMDKLSDISLQAYIDLKNDPVFLEYLANISPLKFFAETNISSRPSHRGGSSKLELKDLRAIPFVGSWSQIKQNITGYYGVGYAVNEIDKAGKLHEITALYKNSLFFRTLIDNCEMTMKKSFFPLTAFLANSPIYAGMWNRIYDEYKLTESCLKKITGKSELMEGYPVEQLSIEIREKIVLPLVTIQQYAMSKIREAGDEDGEAKTSYQKLAMRCSFGIINAGRNSA